MATDKKHILNSFDICPKQNNHCSNKVAWNLNRELETCNPMLADFLSVALLAQSLKGGQKDQGKVPQGATLTTICGRRTPIQSNNGAE